MTSTTVLLISVRMHLIHIGIFSNSDSQYDNDSSPGRKSEIGLSERASRSSTEWSQSGNERKLGQSMVEVHHVFFLKVHKAASTTIMQIMLRFALSHNLTVRLPLHYNLISETSKSWVKFTIPFLPGKERFDILCNHVVFDEKSVRSSLYPDAKLIAIIRHPFEQFVSAFDYYLRKYNNTYLVNIPGQDKIATYLNSPSLYEPTNAGLSYTNNRMSFDFGMNQEHFSNELLTSKYIGYLDNTFDLVLVSERFDESMILMKRFLGWATKDVLYLKSNVLLKKKSNYSAIQKGAHRRANMADYALYDHFISVFDEKVRSGGADFQQEVDAFRIILKAMNAFCTVGSQGALRVTSTVWNDPFEVTRADCALMMTDELPFVELVRERQKQMYYNSTTV